MKFDKSFLKSKTLWTAVLAIVTGFLPDVQHFMSENPEQYAAILGGIFGILRLTTKQALVVKEDKSQLGK